MCLGAEGTAAIALAAMLLDTGGPVWFLIMKWRDDGLWDAR